MKTDVETWCDKCMTCLKFTKIPRKTKQVAVRIPTTAECWEEVMIDLEGPSQPPDKEGNIYSMTYICCLCYGILLERSPECNAHEARRMFACCMFTSGRIAVMLRSDRGPEFKNLLMREYAAIVGLGRRFGTAWRTMEQGLVEGAHKETSKIYGMLVRDVLQCMPHETG